MNIVYRGFSLATFAASIVALTGCLGDVPRVPVSGKITIDGKEPDTTGLVILFLGPDNHLVRADIGPDGTYLAKDVTVGENKVGVVRFGGGAPDVQHTGHQMPDPKDINSVRKELAEAKRKAQAAKAATAKQNMIPQQYNEPNTSGLKATVENSPSSTYNADLKSN